MYKFCHCLTKPIITRIIVSLVFKNIIIRAAVYCSEILWLWLNRNKFCHYFAKPVITRIIVSLVFKNIIIRAAVYCSEILWVWLNKIKFCHYLTKPIIARIIVSLVFENVIIRIEIIVLRDFMTLVKQEQILSLFCQAYYYTNYCVFSV